MSPQPPSSAARLQLFIALHDEYRQMVAAFPVDQQRFVFGGPPRDPADRWSRTFRAIALRKFLISPQDAVYVEKILSAMASEAQGEVALADVDALSIHFKRMPPPVIYGRPDGAHLPAGDVVVDLLYGLYMHGDYDKWLRVKEVPEPMLEHALFQWTARAEDFLNQLRGVLDDWCARKLLTPAE